MRLTLAIIFVSIVCSSAATDKFTLEDFAISLEQTTSAPNHIWVSSGYTTVNPESHTVFGVNNFFSPPFAVNRFNFGIDILIDSIKITDTGSRGKGDVGLLYANGIWMPHKIIRNGTYHHIKNDQLVSIKVSSELIPLFGQAGFLEKITITNRSHHTIPITLSAGVSPGSPAVVDLNKWNFGVPRIDKSLDLKTKKISTNVWSNDGASIQLYEENKSGTLAPGEQLISYFTVLISNIESKLPATVNPVKLESTAYSTWKNRLSKFTKNIPSLESDIAGLDDYYKRSILSGLVCIWENPKFVVNPFFSTAGIDGGGICTYLWDNAGYIPQIATLMLDSSILDMARRMVTIDLQKYYAYSPGGEGVGVKYSYSPWAFTRLVSTIFKFFGPQPDLFDEAKKIVLHDESLQGDNHLIDFGYQHNLLEMRGAGWEHYVASPNAERSWSLNELAMMSGKLGYEAKDLILASETVRRAVQNELWDEDVQWFKSIYPNGFTDYVYTIQVYDALRAGVCTPEMTNALVSHLRDGAFLGKYGVTSISKEDQVHYESIDTDWSGGGAYIGDGPQLAMIMFEQDLPEIGWNILKKHFWMGEHFIYFPQESYVDKPMSPEHKRANVSTGLSGAEAILFGVLGIEIGYEGDLSINPHPDKDGTIKIKDFRFRGKRIDVEVSSDKLKIMLEGTSFYEGPNKLVRILD